MKVLKFTPSLFLALFLFMSIKPVSAAAPQGEARILNFEGQVKTKTLSADWKDAQKGALLGKGDQITTSVNSSCEIALGVDMKSAVKLRPDSKATLVSLDPVKIDIQSGRVLSLVRNLKPGTTFQVSTPTAVAAVRGTGWEQGLDSLQVFEDTVHVTGASGQENDIPEGKGIDIGDDGKLGDIFEVSNEAHSDWNEFKAEAEAHLEAASSETSPESEKKDSGESQETSDEGSKDGASGEPDQDAFGGDTHEAVETSSHEDLGGQNAGPAEDLSDIKSGSTEQLNEEKSLDDRLTNKEPEPHPTNSPY